MIKWVLRKGQSIDRLGNLRLFSKNYSEAIHAMTTHGLNQFAWSIQTTSKRIKSLFYFPLNYQCYKLKCALGFLSVLFSVSQHASSRGVPTNKTE